uniref:NopRA1 domain-containing protein n=1 Tax=Trichuris muris TaxID=70415 RepID=A0A5S6R2C2_TRIMR
MKRRVQLAGNVRADDVVKKPKLDFLASKFEGSKFHYSISQEDADIRSCLLLWSDACDAYEAGKSTVDPVAEFFVHSYDGEELTKWLERVDEPILVHYIVSVVLRILDRVNKSASCYKQRAILVFGQLVRRASKLRRQLCQRCTAYQVEVFTLLTFGAILGPTAVDDLVRFFDVDDPAVARQFRDPLLADSCVKFTTAVIRFASFQALQRICGEKFILQTLLRNVKLCVEAESICNALNIVRCRVIESMEVAKSSKVKILSSCFRSVCSLIGNEALNECLENFFSSCVEHLHVVDIDLGVGERTLNNVLYKLYIELTSHFDSSLVTERVVVKLVRACPDLVYRCLEHDCAYSTWQTPHQFGLLWATMLRETGDQISSFCSTVLDAKALARLAVPDLAIQRLAMPLWKSKNAESIIVASKVFQALISRAKIALRAMAADDRLQTVASIFLETLPTFEEVRQCFLYARQLYANGGPYELPGATAELVASTLLLFCSLHKDFLSNVDIVQIFLTTECFLSMDVKLQLLSLFPFSSVELIDLVRKPKEGKSVVGRLLHYYEKATDKEVIALDNAFCRICQLSEVLGSHSTEIKLWLAAFAHGNGDLARKCFEEVVHAAVCSQYARYEALLRNAEVFEGSWSIDGDMAAIENLFDHFVLGTEQKLEFSILTPTLLWWCEAQECLDTGVEQCVLRCLRLLLWFQKGSRDQLLTVLRNSNSPLASVIVNEEARLERKAKLRKDADAFQTEAFSVYTSNSEASRCCDIFELNCCGEKRIDNFLFLIHLWRKARANNLSSADRMLSLVDRAMHEWQMCTDLFLQVDIVQEDVLFALLRMNLSAEMCFSSPCFAELVRSNIAVYLSDLIVTSHRLSKSKECAERLAPMATAEQLMVTLGSVNRDQKLNFNVFEVYWMQLISFAKSDLDVSVRLSEAACTCVLMDLFSNPLKTLSRSDCVFRVVDFLLSHVCVRLNFANSADLLFRYVGGSRHAANLFLTMQKADRKEKMRHRLVHWVAENSGGLPPVRVTLLPVFGANADCDDEAFLSTIRRLYEDSFTDVALWNKDTVSLAVALIKRLPDVGSLLVSSCSKAIAGHSLVGLDDCMTIFAKSWHDCLSAMELLVSCIEHETTVTNFELTLVSRVKSQWRPPIGSTIYRELWQLILARRFASAEHVQLICQMVGSLKCTMHLPIVSMIFGHSMFGSVVVLGKEELPKYALVALLLVCCESDPSVMESSHVPALLSSYGATLGLADTTILKLLTLYEASGIDLSIFHPLVWGPTALSSFVNWKQLGPSLWNRPLASEVLNCIDEEKMQRTISSFPLELDFDLHHSWPAADLYDPRFLLPTFAGILRCETVVNCRQFVSTNCLGFVLCGLSFADRDLRALCYSNLVDFHEALNGSENFAEKSQLSLLIALVRQSVAKDNQRLPFVIGLFLCRAVSVFMNPRNPVYPTLCLFLLIRPRMDLSLVPNFFRFFHSAGPEHRHERLWILNLLADGLRTNVDFQIACRLYTFKFLFSFYHCSLCERNQRAAILRAVVAVSRIPKAAMALCREHNWLGFLATLCRGPTPWSAVEVLRNIFRFIFRRKRSLRWNLAVGWTSCASSALSKAAIRSTDNAEAAVRLTTMLLKAYSMHPFGSTVSQLSDIVDKLDPYVDAANACTLRRMLGKAFVQAFCVVGAASISNALLQHYLSNVYRTCPSDKLLVNTIRKLRKLCKSDCRFDASKAYFRNVLYATKVRTL